MFKEKYNKHSSSNTVVRTIKHNAFKNCAPLTDCTTKKSNTEIGNTKKPDLDAVAQSFRL